MTTRSKCPRRRSAPPRQAPARAGDSALLFPRPLPGGSRGARTPGDAESPFSPGLHNPRLHALVAGTCAVRPATARPAGARATARSLRRVLAGFAGLPGSDSSLPHFGGGSHPIKLVPVSPLRGGARPPPPRLPGAHVSARVPTPPHPRVCAAHALRASGAPGVLPGCSQGFRARRVSRSALSTGGPDSLGSERPTLPL